MIISALPCNDAGDASTEAAVAVLVLAMMNAYVWPPKIAAPKTRAKTAIIEGGGTINTAALRPSAALNALRLSAALNALNVIVVRSTRLKGLRVRQTLRLTAALNALNALDGTHG